MSSGCLERNKHAHFINRAIGRDVIRVGDDRTDDHFYKLLVGLLLHVVLLPPFLTVQTSGVVLRKTAFVYWNTVRPLA